MEGKTSTDERASTCRSEPARIPLGRIRRSQSQSGWRSEVKECTAVTSNKSGGDPPSSSSFDWKKLLPIPMATPRWLLPVVDIRPAETVHKWA